MNILKVLRDIFVPNHTNNYRPHALAHRSLSLYAGVMISVKLLTLFSLDMLPENRAFSSAVTSQNILQLTNLSRQAFGLGPLNENFLLDKAAAAKAEDMIKNQYFAHVSPTGTTAWNFIKGQGYNYIIAGENLAINFYSSEAVENAWMNSPGHKANILNKDFQDIGIGVAQGELKGVKAVFVVQMFGTSVDQPYVARLSYTIPQSVQQQPTVIVPTPEGITLPVPIIENPLFNLTNKNAFQVRGYIPGATSAYVLVNQRAVAKLDLVEGHFSGMVPVSEGDNSIEVLGFNNLQASPISKTIEVKLDSSAPEFSSTEVKPMTGSGGTYYQIEVQTQGDAVKVLASLNDQSVLLQPTANSNVWQGVIYGQSGEQGKLNLTAYDLAGNTKLTSAATISKSMVDTFGFSAVQDLKVGIMGNNVSLKDVNKLYAYAILFLLISLAVAIGVKRHIQHPDLIAHASAMAMLAVLFLVT